jgi:hypothetical protein
MVGRGGQQYILQHNEIIQTTTIISVLAEQERIPLDKKGYFVRKLQFLAI